MRHDVRAATIAKRIGRRRSPVDRTDGAPEV